jgi:hypothetical protein
MAPKGKSKGGGGGSLTGWLRWPAWVLGVLAIGSAFAPRDADLVRVLHWTVFLFAILGAGTAVGTGRRGAFLAYAAMAILVNPLVPFDFPQQVWRLIHAGAGLWLIADHLKRRD